MLPLTRRELLRIAGLVGVGGALRPFLIVPEGDIYTNPGLGLELVKPSGWRFLSTVDYAAMREDQEFGTDDPAILQISDSVKPSLLVAKYPEPCQQVNPNVSLWVEPIEGDEPPLEYHKLALEGLAVVLPAFRVVGPVRVENLGGAAATASSWSCEYRTPNGCSLLEGRTWLLFRPNRTTHTWTFVSPKANRVEVAGELRQMLSGIRYV